jgi:hypothetical protein
MAQGKSSKMPGNQQLFVTVFLRAMQLLRRKNMRE